MLVFANSAYIPWDSQAQGADCARGRKACEILNLERRPKCPEYENERADMRN